MPPRLWVAERGIRKGASGALRLDCNQYNKVVGSEQGNRIKLIEAAEARNRYPSLRGSVFAVSCFCLCHA